MPCGFWGAGAAYWWILPLIGLVLMGAMFFVCSRGFGCMGWRRRGSGEPSGLQGEAGGDELRRGCCGPGTRSAPTGK